MNTSVADVDVVAARSEIHAGSTPDADVVDASGVVVERKTANSSIVVTFAVLQ
jgi:hypothetical protein